MAQLAMSSDRIAELERELRDARETIAIIDRQQQRLLVQTCCYKCGYQHPPDWLLCMAEEGAKPQTDIDRVCDQLDRGSVSNPDQQRLRKSLDKAGAPPTGKDRANEAVWQISGRPK